MRLMERFLKSMSVTLIIWDISLNGLVGGESVSEIKVLWLRIAKKVNYGKC